MAYGLQITNPSGELVLSDETYFPVYLGIAAVSSVAQPSGGGPGTSANGSASGGISTCTFNYAGQIVPVLRLPPGYSGSVYSCSQSGSTWTITVSFTDGTSNGDTTDARFQMFNQITPTVYVFGFPIALGGNYGCAIYNDSGTLTGDLTRRPLLLKERVHFASGSNTASFSSSISNPGLVGRCFDTYYTGGPTSFIDTYRDIYRQWIINLNPGSLTRVSDKRSIRNDTDSGGVTTHNALDVWLVECAGLT